jgi:manganese/zinc/iron transport system permease protein
VTRGFQTKVIARVVPKVRMQFKFWILVSLLLVGAPAASADVTPLMRVLTLQDYNTRVVVVGILLLGIAAGVIGSFMLLRKRALVGDAVSHATLPGLCAAFMIMASMGGDGKWLPGLLLGALVTGGLGILMVLWIRSQTKLKEDTALGIVLSVFFGMGVSLLGIIQKMRQGHAAGLESFIYGKTASMLAGDAMLIGGAAFVVITTAVLLFKEFRLLCFDEAFAKSQGWPVRALDIVMMLLVVTVTVIGLQAVGLILMIALLVIPPATARFWTEHLQTLVWLSAITGGISGLIGALASALVPNLPAGAVIVLVAAAFFVFSMLFGSRRGVVIRFFEHWKLSRKVGRQHLLRALYEWVEESSGTGPDELAAERESMGISFESLLPERSWHPRQLRRWLRDAMGQGNIYDGSDGLFHLTREGWSEARRVVRNHRLWEIYLIEYADIAPSHVDRDADMIEHVLGRAMVDELEALLRTRYPHLAMPPSPHTLSLAGGRS